MVKVSIQPCEITGLPMAPNSRGSIKLIVCHSAYHHSLFCKLLVGVLQVDARILCLPPTHVIRHAIHHESIQTSFQGSLIVGLVHSPVHPGFELPCVTRVSGRFVPSFLVLTSGLCTRYARVCLCLLANFCGKVHSLDSTKLKGHPGFLVSVTFLLFSI